MNHSTKTHHNTKEKSSFKKLYEIFTPRERMQAGLLFLASLITAFAQAIGVASVFPFINVVMDPNVIHENTWLSNAYRMFEFKSDHDFIVVLGVCVFLAVIVSSVISTLTIWAKTRFVLGKNHTLSHRLLRVYLSKPYQFFLEKNTSELGKNILAEINQLTSQFLMAVFETIIHGLILVIMIGMLLMIETKSTLGVIGLLGLTYGLMNNLIKKRLKTKGRKRLSANAERYRYATEALSSIKITKVMQNEEYFLNQYEHQSSKFAQYNIFANLAKEIPRYLLEGVAFGGIVFFVLWMLTTGESINQLIPLVSLYAFAGYRMMPAINRVYSSITTLHFNQATLDKLYDDIMEKDVENQMVDHCTELSFLHQLELKDLVFHYSGQSIPVINGINLTIPKNTVIGFVGATGSGKTTLVDLILGLHLPQQGQMLVDGIPITSQNLKAWQQKIGYVPQEIYLSDDTIRKNIAFGVPNKQIDEQQVKLAAQIAALDEFIENQLPQKYDTIIGERGVRLSGGQRQRIGLARAIYRNPEILVLDEATSSLDGTTEEAVLQAIGSASRARTVIMIAHRLNTLKDCDQIYMMDQGEIVSQGTYEELIHENTTFMQMAKVSES